MALKHVLMFSQLVSTPHYAITKPLIPYSHTLSVPGSVCVYPVGKIFQTSNIQHEKSLTSDLRGNGNCFSNLMCVDTVKSMPSYVEKGNGDDYIERHISRGQWPAFHINHIANKTNIHSGHILVSCAMIYCVGEHKCIDCLLTGLHKKTASSYVRDRGEIFFPKIIVI